MTLKRAGNGLNQVTECRYLTENAENILFTSGKGSLSTNKCRCD